MLSFYFIFSLIMLLCAATTQWQPCHASAKLQKTCHFWTLFITFQLFNPSEKLHEWERILLNVLKLKLSIGFDANIKSRLIYFENK